ncbi:ABC-type branched-subunit amino acid transport system ATPase component, partial [Bradyrhizobium sp. LA2.1]
LSNHLKVVLAKQLSLIRRLDALDPCEISGLGDRLKEIAARGITILVVEHNVPFVLRVCDRLLLLENGQVTCRADLKERLPASLAAYLRHDPTPTPVRAAS